MKKPELKRRTFLASASAALGTLTLSPVEIPEELGAPRRHYGERSRYETTTRYFVYSPTPGTGASRTPLQDLCGIITPSALHFERRQAGVPQVNPQEHERIRVRSAEVKPSCFMEKP